MAPEWTAAQLAAIDTRGCNLLVSAAAGSGKTAALTERIIRSLTRESNPADITRILAVTFTRASAAELRRRISKALAERLSQDPGNRHLIRQLMLLGSAKICTIDSFYNEIVKSNFQRLSLPAGFRIADDAELRLLEKSVMEDLIDRSFWDPGFAALSDNFIGNKEDKLLSEFFIKLYESVRKYPEGIEYLKTGAEQLKAEAKMSFFKTRAGGLIASQLIEELNFYLRIFNSACAEFRADDTLRTAYFEGFASDCDFISSFIEAVICLDYEKARNIIYSYSPKKLGRLNADSKTPAIESYKAWRDKIKKRLKDIASTYFKRAESSIPETFIKTADVCMQLYNFISQYDKLLHDEKLSRGICDFEDIRRYTLALLTDGDGNPTDIARSYASQFDEILIDEYQDVDEVQDIIFRALSVSSHRFMVGDIKQSIYGFRGAEPSLFAGYRKAFLAWEPGYGNNNKAGGESCGGMSIFMSENFRCDENVIKFVNLVCSRIFPACGESVGYVGADDLIFSKGKPDGYLSLPVSVTLIHKEKTISGKEDPDNSLADDSSAESETNDIRLPEMRFIAAEISRLLREGKKADGSAIKPGDIAVLCRSRRVCANVSESLRSLGIPTAGDIAEEYFSDPEASLMLSLLTLIDNPQKDIPAAAVMRSPLFGFTMDEMACIRKKSGKSVSLFEAAEKAAQTDMECASKCRRFVEQINAYRVLARSLPADRLMKHIILSTPSFSLSNAADGKKSGRLLGLYEYARQFEAGSFKGLYNFIKYVNSAVDEDAELTAECAEPGADAVTVITIHHSKGLEFPVCFVVGCAIRFNTNEDAKKDFIPDRAVGPAVRIKDSTGLAKIGTQIRRASQLYTERKQIEEEMRLLYVAMTRARERLYLTARYAGSLESKLNVAEFKRRYGESYGVLSAKCYLDWLLLTISEGQPNGAPYIFNIITDSEVPAPVPVKYDAVTQGAPEEKCDADKLEMLLDEKFSYVYPYAHLTKIPAKLSVSRLYPGVLDESSDNGVQLEECGVDEGSKNKGGIQDAYSGTRLKAPALPAFLAGSEEKIKSADRGTATHVFLQFCDFLRCRKNGIESELQFLAEKGFISSHMASLVDRRQIEAFFASDFYASLIGAAWIKREQRFNILLPAASFSESADFAETLRGEELLVQGVIDIFFEDSNGRLILADYKTDYLTGAEISNAGLAAAKLAGRHRMQLSYYAAALSRICGKRPDKVLIYSLPLGGAVEVNVEIL
jgi:ATP-dependent helicase/nuclease subunit A